MTLTGLGLKISGLIVALAGGHLFLTVVYSALAVWMLGLAVPVTASYIIAAVMVAPALVQAGVPDVAAHMFIFYYAVLSEVSPPTALSPFAAAALTGGNPFPTMMLTWKYTLPAFLVPVRLHAHARGPRRADAGDAAGIATVTLTAAAGIAALAAAFGGLDSRSGVAPRTGPRRAGGRPPLLRRGLGGPGWPRPSGLVLFLHFGWRPAKLADRLMR